MGFNLNQNNNNRLNLGNNINSLAQQNNQFQQFLMSFNLGLKPFMELGPEHVRTGTMDGEGTNQRPYWTETTAGTI